MEKIKVNPLPVKTWHWVGLNDAEVNIEPGATLCFKLSGEGEGLTWLPSLEAVEAGALGERKAGTAGATVAPFPGRESWQEIETGMGQEFAKLLQNAETAALDIPQGYKSENAAVITVSVPNNTVNASGQLLIRAGALSTASVIIVLQGTEESVKGSAALQVLFQAEPGSELRLYVLQQLPATCQSFINMGGVCGDDASVKLNYLSLGANSAYVGLAVGLQGKGSAFSGDLGYRLGRQQNLDINYVARHYGCATKSEFNAAGVLEETAKKSFRGTIDFKRGCCGAVGAEQEEVLLLGSSQENKTIPIILCNEEDVEGSHGATISRPDEDMLFYLASRGIEREAAENMLAAARPMALANRIPDENVRLLALQLINQGGLK